MYRIEVVIYTETEPSLSLNADIIKKPTVSKIDSNNCDIKSQNATFVLLSHKYFPR